MSRRNVRYLADRAHKVTSATLGATTALVWGEAGSNEVTIDSPTLSIDPDGADRTLTLPAEATSTGVCLTIINAGGFGEDITLQDDGAGYTVATIRADEQVKVSCDGTTWRRDSEVVQGVQYFTTQTIDMADAQVALSLDGAAMTTQITANVLLVDANSGATEDLLLPPEAGAAGLVLYIMNTGGESIVVKEDGDSTTIVTIATAEGAIVACDGTTWRGFVGAVT